MIIATGNCADDIIQSALCGPTLGKLLVLRFGGLLSDDISGTLQEKLAKCLPRRFIQQSRFERCPHMLQPSASLGGANSETRVRLTKAQPPSLLGLLLITAQKLNQESAELVDRASETLAREERTKNGVFADTRVKLR